LSTSGEIRASKNSKYTDQQIKKCIEYLQKGHSERYVALILGPDWTRENVRYYKRKYLKRREIEIKNKNLFFN